MSKRQIIFLSLAAAAIAALALFRFKWGTKAYLIADLPNITSGAWRPKAGEYVGEVVELDAANNAVAVGPAFGSVLEKNGLNFQVYLPQEAVKLVRGIILSKK